VANEVPRLRFEGGLELMMVLVDGMVTEPDLPLDEGVNLNFSAGGEEGGLYKIVVVI